MPARIVERQENAVTVQISIPLNRSMLDTEEAIQKALNEAGVLATGEALEQFDTDGSPLLLGSTRWTSKGQEPKTYQTPYGEVSVARHVYQTGEGGATFCPLERDARIILTSTPRFAKQISNKYGEGPAAITAVPSRSASCRTPPQPLPPSSRPRRNSGTTPRPSCPNRSAPSAWGWTAPVCLWSRTGTGRPWWAASASLTRKGSDGT